MYVLLASTCAERPAGRQNAGAFSAPSGPRSISHVAAILRIAGCQGASARSLNAVLSFAPLGGRATELVPRPLSPRTARTDPVDHRRSAISCGAVFPGNPRQYPPSRPGCAESSRSASWPYPVASSTATGTRACSSACMRNTCLPGKVSPPAGCSRPQGIGTRLAALRSDIASKADRQGSKAARRPCGSPTRSGLRSLGLKHRCSTASRRPGSTASRSRRSPQTCPPAPIGERQLRAGFRTSPATLRALMRSHPLRPWIFRNNWIPNRPIRFKSFTQRENFRFI